MFALNEPSALLSNARLAIATLIQRPSTVTTSNAFDEFAVLDQLIDVSNDVDRFEGGESRKFLNIAQLITASTCIYSRRVDALYKLISTFQTSSTNQLDENDESEAIPIVEQEECQPKKILQTKKTKIKDQHQSFICNDLNRISLNSSKTFFLDRTSLFDLKLFQSYVPIGNKQFWTNDHRPMIFDLLFDEQVLEKNEDMQLIDVFNQTSPEKQALVLNNNDIPLPISAYDDQESSWNNESVIDLEKFSLEKRKSSKTRRKKMQNDLDLNLFRHGLSTDQQALFRFQKFKPAVTKIKQEQRQFFVQNFHRKHFEILIKDSPPSILSIFIYPSITTRYLSIRERYSTKIDRPPVIRSPALPIADALNENLFPQFSPSFIDDVEEDMDTRLQTDMEQLLNAATLQTHEEQEHNQVFLELRSSIITYMTEHESVRQTNVDDLLQSLPDQYSLALIFSQLLHLCASTQGYSLHSTANDNLFIEKK